MPIHADMYRCLSCSRSGRSQKALIKSVSHNRWISSAKWEFKRTCSVHCIIFKLFLICEEYQFSPSTYMEPSGLVLRQLPKFLDWLGLHIKAIKRWQDDGIRGFSYDGYLNQRQPKCFNLWLPWRTGHWLWLPHYDTLGGRGERREKGRPAWLGVLQILLHPWLGLVAPCGSAAHALGTTELNSWFYCK